MFKKFFILLIVFLSLATGAFAAERVYFSGSQIKSLAPDGSASLNRILDNGNLLVVAEPGGGENASLIIVNPTSKKVEKRVELPVKTVNYVAADPSGKKSVVYSEFTGAFAAVDFASGKCNILLKKEKGEPGFALYGHRQSRLSFTGDSAFAWGYFYDKEFRFDGEYVVKIDLSKTGVEAFEKLISFDRIRETAKKNLAGAKAIKNIEIVGNYLVFTPQSKRGGCISVYRLAQKVNFELTDFKEFIDSDIAGGKPVYACIIATRDTPRSQGSLYVYDLDERTAEKLATGKLYNPVFAPGGDLIAVGRLKMSGETIQTEIAVINLAKRDFSTKIYLVTGKKYVDWKFVNNNKYLILFDGKDLYRLKLEK